MSDSIIIPRIVDRIGKFTFTGAETLKSVTLPKTVSYIAPDTFSECRSLQTIYCEFGTESIPGAPWGAPETAKVLFNCFYEDKGGDVVSGGDVDLSFITAAVGDILDGRISIDAKGKRIVGNIPTVTASQDGNTVTVPAGFIENEQTFTVSGGNEIDTSGATVTADKMLDGVKAVNADGDMITGTIKTVSATLSGNVTTVPAGYIAEKQTLTVPAVTPTLADNAVTVPQGYISSKQTLTVAEAAEPSVSANVVTVKKGYNKEQKTVTIPEAGQLTVDKNVVTVPVGYIKSQRTATVAKATATLSANKVTIPAGYHDANTLTVAEAAAPTTSGNVVTVNKGYQAAQKKITVGTAKAAETITPGTTDQSIAAGTYLTGELTIKGDANFKESIIAKGETLFGLVGTYEGSGGGGGGADVPFPSDYIFYEPLGSTPTTAGVAVTGTPTYTTLWGIPCVQLTTKGDGIVWSGLIDDKKFSTPHTVAFAFCGNDSGISRMFYRRHPNSGNYGSLMPRIFDETAVSNSSFQYGSNNVYCYCYKKWRRYEWFTVVMTADAEKNATLYINGKAVSTTAVHDGYYEDVSTFCIGGDLSSTVTDPPTTVYPGHYADLRFYDRALSAAEVLKVHESLKPVVPEATGKFTVTGDDWFAGEYIAEPGTFGAGRCWMKPWDGESDERQGIAWDGEFWAIGSFWAEWEELPDGEYVMTGKWDWSGDSVGYYDPSRQFDENFENLIGTPLGMGVAAPDMAGTWCTAGDPTEGQVTVVYSEN